MKINETTVTTGSPGTKGYTGYISKEEYTKYKSDLAKIVKKTTGYEIAEFEPVVVGDIDNDNEINDYDVDDKNIASLKRHKKLEKDFIKQMAS